MMPTTEHDPFLYARPTQEMDLHSLFGLNYWMSLISKIFFPDFRWKNEKEKIRVRVPSSVGDGMELPFPPPRKYFSRGTDLG